MTDEEKAVKRGEQICEEAFGEFARGLFVISHNGKDLKTAEIQIDACVNLLMKMREDMRKTHNAPESPGEPH